MQLNRRRFLLGSLLATQGKHLAAAGPALRFPAAPRERLAVASYSLRTLMDTPRNRARANQQHPLIDIKAFPEMVVKRFNVTNMELLGQHLPSTEPAYLAEFRAAVKGAGSHIINIPTSVGGSLYDRDSAKRTIAVENAKKWIDTAVALDCPSVRIHIQGVPNTTPDVDRTVTSLHTVTHYAASQNIIVTLENDDLVSEDAFFLVKVIDQINNPWLRALPDFCNSMLGSDEKFNYEAVTAMFKRAYNISHMKDSEVERDKVIRIDVARTFAIAKASGYKGYFSIEFEGEGDPILGTEKLIEESIKQLS